MNAAAERQIDVDLRDRQAWDLMTAKDGATLDDVIISYCGRFTIVRHKAIAHLPESFVAFRRFGQPEFKRWSPPRLLGKYHTGDQARDRCARVADDPDELMAGAPR